MTTEKFGESCRNVTGEYEQDADEGEGQGRHGGGGEREAKRAKLSSASPGNGALTLRPEENEDSSGGIHDGTSADNRQVDGWDSSSTAAAAAAVASDPIVAHGHRNEAPEVGAGEAAPSQQQHPDESTSHSLLPLSMRMMAPFASFAHCGCCQPRGGPIDESLGAQSGYYCSYDPTAAARNFGGDGTQIFHQGAAENEDMNGKGAKRNAQGARRAGGASVEGLRHPRGLRPSQGGNGDKGNRNGSDNVVPTIANVTSADESLSSMQRRNKVTDQNGGGAFREEYNGVHRYPPLHRQPIESAVESLFRAYLASCNLYSCQPNPGILTALRFSLPTLRVSANFHDADALALCELLLQHCNTTLRHVTRLDFSVATRRFGGKLYGQLGFKSHGAFALSKVLQKSRHIREVMLQRNRIGPFGASAIFRAISGNPNSVESLAMRRCQVGERGAEAFARYVVESRVCRLREIDLSNNFIGFRGSTVVCDALHVRQKRGRAESDGTIEVRQKQGRRAESNGTIEVRQKQGRAESNGTIEVDLSGNLIFQEVMNCVTHGLGIILCIIGTILLTRRVRHRPVWAVAACGIYSASLLVLYTSSTLFHSFFALRTTKYVFGILDHCSIYVLIAGSYTPILGISLQHEPMWSVYLLAFVWVCCFCGVYVEAFCTGWKHKSLFSLAMYLGMGWSCVVCLPDLIAVLPQGAINLLVLGGVAYTAGVPFFVRNNNLDHSIWHLFVLSASIFHWFSIFSYVTLLAEEKDVGGNVYDAVAPNCAVLTSSSCCEVGRG